MSQPAAAAGVEPAEAPWALATYAGCRLDKLTGLTWSDIDLDARVLHVRRALVKVQRGVPIFGEPKTARIRRTVPLAEAAIEALSAHRSRREFERSAAGKNRARHDLVFATP